MTISTNTAASDLLERNRARIASAESELTRIGAAEQERVRTVRAELVKVEQEFAKNIREDVREVALDPRQLEGLPPDYIAAHPADADGRVHVSTNYPDLIPFMTYANDETGRRELAIVNGVRDRKSTRLNSSHRCISY